MALEYLYDCIRATAGEGVDITATITDAEGAVVEDGCSLALYDSEGATIINVDGRYVEEMQSWQFSIPASVTAQLSGRYFYRVFRNDNSMNFQTPIYFE